jgi:class 3 adenylate cyclase
VATVLFADIVGFTQLAEGLDPESAKRLVDTCLERLAEDVTNYGGRVDKVMGDGILALFGAPVAHEDDAERAVRAALAMPSTVAAIGRGADAPVRVRVGVNTGEVIVGSMRAGGEYTAMGDVVNTAQRLQSVASPGAVVVGAATRAATHEVIAYRDLGEVHARGRDEPVAAWEALEALLPPGARPRRSTVPLVGRDGERSLLDAAVDLAVRRRRSHLLVVLGEAGMGKSRLAHEVATGAGERYEALVLDGRCLPYGEANVWWPVAEAARGALDVPADADAATAADGARASVATVLAVDADAPVVERTASGLVQLMGYPVPHDELDPQGSRGEVVAAVLALLDALTARRPVVLSLSDLHWADPVVLELVGTALDRLERRPFVVVATIRGDLPESLTSGSGERATTVVPLDALDDEAAGRLLDALTSVPLSPATRQTVLDRSGGNPLFLEELAALLSTPQGSGDPAAAEHGLDALGSLRGDADLAELPDTLRGLVAARIDALGPVESAVLDDAAVWGRSGPLDALAQLARQVHGLDDLDAGLGGLVDGDILEVAGGGGRSAPIWSARWPTQPSPRPTGLSGTTASPGHSTGWAGPESAPTAPTATIRTTAGRPRATGSSRPSPTTTRPPPSWWTTSVG